MSDTSIRYLNSRHRFVNTVIRLILNLKVIMEVDDSLVERGDEDEAIEKFTAFLTWFRKFNIKLA